MVLYFKRVILQNIPQILKMDILFGISFVFIQITQSRAISLCKQLATYIFFIIAEKKFFFGNNRKLIENVIKYLLLEYIICRIYM